MLIKYVKKNFISKVHTNKIIINFNTSVILQSNLHSVESNLFYTSKNFKFSKRSSKEWMDRHLSDQYVKKTKIFEYRSRAAFKLLEIHQKYKLLRPGQKVLDVGSSPGGWSQIIAEYTKSTEKDKNVIAVDILHMDSVNGVYFIQGNINKQEIQDEILNKNNYEKFDLILSDMCPEFTGIKSSDHVNLIELNKITIDFALKVLKRKGNLVIKTFEGTLQKKLQDGIKKYFNKVNCFKPSSSRSDSSEMFLVCISYLENENLRQEADEITKLSAEEYFEQQKNNAIREYKIAKLNNLTLLEDLDKMKEEILNKFKIDPDKLKLDEKEEKELKKIIDDENEKIRQDLYGRSYKPIPKNKSLGQFIDDYQKEMKDIDEKLRTLIGKDKVEMDEYEQFFKEDADEKHLDEITESRLKEVEFLEKNIDALEKSIKDEDANELLRKDGKENEILAKYKRWEKALDDYNNEITEIEKSEVSDEISGERIKEDLNVEDENLLKGIQKLKKNVKKTKNIKEQNLPDESEIFFRKRTKRNSKVE